jgi:hypothetical protein
LGFSFSAALIGGLQSVLLIDHAIVRQFSVLGACSGGGENAANPLQKNIPGEGQPTAVNIFICILINEKTGREGEAPAEFFAAAA